MENLIDKKNETCRIRLNEDVPASALIKTLAQQKRDLSIENLDLKRELEILKDDIKAYKSHQATASHKDINKCANSLMQVYATLGKKFGAITELTEATRKLYDLLSDILENQDDGTSGECTL